MPGAAAALLACLGLALATAAEGRAPQPPAPKFRAAGEEAVEQAAPRWWLRRLAARRPRSPIGVAKRLARKASLRPRSVSAPPQPYCYRGDNGPVTDPLPSGPCSYEVLNPTSGAAPKATIMIIAGGGWRGASSYVSIGQVRQFGKVWRDAGFQTIAVELTSAQINGVGKLGAYGYEDIVQWYDLLRYQATRYVGPSYPVCVGGASSSGHIALLLAVVRRPACIVTEAAPTDLSALKGSASNRAYKVAVEAFGPSGLGRWSPASYASPPYFGLPIALGHLPDDQLVPASQMTSFAVGRPAVQSFTATPTGGATPPPECANYDLYLQRSFAHLCYAGQLGITRISFDRWRTLEVSVVESALA